MVDEQPGARRRAANLGCGKVLFSSTPEEEWLNVDRLPLPGVDEQVDVFAYPWPWPDTSFDHLHASHLIEHIPHEARLRAAVLPPPLSPAQQRWREVLRPLDGFFAFFAEAWRVLRPEGTIHCVAPHGHSDGALWDPTHTRAILPATLSYLTGQEAGTFDYRLPFHFAFIGLTLHASAEYQGRTADELAGLALRHLNVFHTLEFVLQKAPLPNVGAESIR